jgi:hypothetical protein
LPGSSSCSASAARAPRSAPGAAVTRSTGPSRKPAATGTTSSIHRKPAASSNRRCHPTSPGWTPPPGASTGVHSHSARSAGPVSAGVRRCRARQIMDRTLASAPRRHEGFQRRLPTARTDQHHLSSPTLRKPATARFAPLDGRPRACVSRKEAGSRPSHAAGSRFMIVLSGRPGRRLVPKDCGDVRDVSQAPVARVHCPSPGTVGGYCSGSGSPRQSRCGSSAGDPQMSNGHGGCRQDRRADLVADTGGPGRHRYGRPATPGHRRPVPGTSAGRGCGRPRGSSSADGGPKPAVAALLARFQAARTASLAELTALGVTGQDADRRGRTRRSARSPSDSYSPPGRRPMT